MDWFTVLSAFGVGAIVSTLVQSLLSIQKENDHRRFSERKEAYVGLLNAWLQDSQEGSPEKNKFANGHWVERCQLVGSDDVHMALEEWQAGEPDSEDRIKATQKVKLAMRRDLR